MILLILPFLLFGLHGKPDFHFYALVMLAPWKCIQLALRFSIFICLTILTAESKQKKKKKTHLLVVFWSDRWFTFMLLAQKTSKTWIDDLYLPWVTTQRWEPFHINAILWQCVRLFHGHLKSLQKADYICCCVHIHNSWRTGTSFDQFLYHVFEHLTFSLIWILHHTRNLFVSIPLLLKCH